MEWNYNSAKHSLPNKKIIGEQKKGKENSNNDEQTSVASFLFCCSIYVIKLSEED